MADDVAINLRQFLMGRADLAAVCGERVHKNQTPQTLLETDGEFPPYVWFSRADSLREECTNSPVGEEPDAIVFDVELIAFFDADAGAMLEAVEAFDGYAGEFGNGNVQAVFVDNQSDDYVPRGLPTNVGCHVRSVQLSIHRW